MKPPLPEFPDLVPLHPGQLYFVDTEIPDLLPHRGVSGTGVVFRPAGEDEEDAGREAVHDVPEEAPVVARGEVDVV